MKCHFCEHIIRRRDELCNKCGERYPRMRRLNSKFKCKNCGSYDIFLEADKEELKIIKMQKKIKLKLINSESNEKENSNGKH